MVGRTAGPAGETAAGPTEPGRAPIVLLFGGYGAVQMACLKAWRDAGIEIVYAHLTDDAALTALEPLLLAYRPLRTADVSTSSGLDELRALALRYKCDAAVAVAAKQVSILREALAGLDCIVCAPSPTCINLLETKLPQVEMARAAGLPVAPTWIIRRAADCDEVPESAFPLVLRPNSPEAAMPAFKAEYVASRTRLVDLVAAQTGSETLLVAQPFVAGPNLIVHGARDAGGEILQMAAFVADYKFEGVSQRLVPTALDPVLAQRCARFAELADLVGVFHFDFILADADRAPLFLEVNARLGGTTNKILRLGYREPRYLLECFGLLPRSHETPRIRRRSVVNSLSLLKRLLAIWRDGDSSIDYPRLSKLAALPRFLPLMLFAKEETIDMTSWRATLAFYAQVVMGRVR